MMNFITAKEAAENWGISQRRVSTLCSEGRIEAEMKGNMWLIPDTVEKPIDARTIKRMDNKKNKPIVKWVGGKGQIINEIRARYPKKLGTKINKYAEPFVGGGAVLFELLANFDFDEVYINDSNKALINMYKYVRDNVDELIALLKEYEDEYNSKNEAERKIYYYNKRDRFNKLKTENKHSVVSAALFIFLNKTCFNGLYRENKRGEFNVPMGSYKMPTICDEENLRRASDALQGVIIDCGDYHQSEKFIDKNTFVYFDPPYRPLNVTSSFTSYTKDSFNDEDQIELAKYIHKLSKKGASVLASNSDPKNIDKNDNFFDDLYSPLNIYRVYASRMINSNGNSRGKVSELLVSNY